MADNALMNFLQETFTKTADPNPERSKTSNLKQTNYIPEEVIDVAQRAATNPAVLKSALIHMPEVVGASALNTLAVKPAVEAAENAKFISDFLGSPASFAKVLGHQEDGTPILDDPSKPLPPGDKEISQFALDVGMAGLGTSFAGGAPRGSIGMFAGDTSKLADIYSWDNANKLRMSPGITHEAIRKQTGWFVGMDDVLRHEISDYPVKIDTSKFIPASKGDAITFQGGLQDAFIHPELYKAYPELKDVEFSSIITNKQGMGGHGTFDPSANKIYSNAENTEILRKNMLHEIQHWVQEYEGFAPGGNPNMRFVSKDRKNVADLFHQDAALDYYSFMKPNLATVEKLVKQDPYLLNLYDAKNAKEVYSKMFDAYAKDVGEFANPTTIAGIVERDQRTNMYMYRNLAGEIEARDTAARSDIMPDFLNMYPPTISDRALVLHPNSPGLVHSYDEIKSALDK